MVCVALLLPGNLAQYALTAFVVAEDIVKTAPETVSLSALKPREDMATKTPHERKEIDVDEIRKAIDEALGGASPSSN